MKPPKSIKYSKGERFVFLKFNLWLKKPLFVTFKVAHYRMYCSINPLDVYTCGTFWVSQNKETRKYSQDLLVKECFENIEDLVKLYWFQPSEFLSEEDQKIQQKLYEYFKFEWFHLNEPL